MIGEFFNKIKVASSEISPIYLNVKKNEKIE